MSNVNPDDGRLNFSQSPVLGLENPIILQGLTNAYMVYNTVEPLYSGHPWGTTSWPLYMQGWLLFKGFGTMKVYIAKFIPDQSLWPLYSIWLLFRGGC